MRILGRLKLSLKKKKIIIIDIKLPKNHEDNREKNSM